MLLYVLLFTGTCGLIPNDYTEQVHNYPNGITWQEADDICATDGIENDPFIIANIPSLQGTQFWKGEKVYNITLPWIESLGCYSFSSSDIATIYRLQSIGLCENECSAYSMFGYKENTNECVCLTKQGMKSTSTFCRDTNINNYFFVYKHSHDIISEYMDKGGKNCVTSMCSWPQTITLKVADCHMESQSVAGICVDEQRQHTEPIWLQTQQTIQDYCFEHDKRLPSSSYCGRIGINVWTNIFRVREKFILPVSKAANLTAISCRTAKFESGLKTTDWLDMDTPCDSNVTAFVCKKSRYILLTKRNDTTTPTVQNGRSNTKLDDSSDELSKQYITSPRNIDSTSEDIIDRPILGVIIGSTILLIVVIAAFVLWIICRKKCIAIHKKDSKAELENIDNVFSNENEQRPSDTANIQSLDVKICDSLKVDVSSLYAQVNKKPKGMFEQINVSTIYSDLHGEYDCLNIVNHTNVLSADNTYDISAGGCSTEDPTYNVSAVTSLCKDDNGGIYDHSYH